MTGLGAVGPGSFPFLPAGLDCLGERGVQEGRLDGCRVVLSIQSLSPSCSSCQIFWSFILLGPEGPGARVGPAVWMGWDQEA